MRNSTMQDKLTAVLGVPKRKTLSAAETRRGASTGQSLRSAERLREITRAFIDNRSENFGPRYIAPPRRKNPFSVHAHAAPALDIVTEMKLAEGIETAAVEAESPPEPQAEIQQTENREQGPEEHVPENRDGETEDSEQPPSPGFLSPLVPVPPSAAHSADLVAPAVRFPPELAWLEQETPFIEPLKFMVARVRGAKASVGFTLEQSIRRQKQWHMERDAIDVSLGREELVEIEQREKLRKLDDMISACALMAEQSMTVDQDLLIPQAEKKSHKTQETKAADGAKPAPRAYRRWDRSDNSVCRKEEIIRFFYANPNTNWRAPEIRKLLPATKQAHAKEYLSPLLNNLFKEGLLQRPGEGIYRYVPSE